MRAQFAPSLPTRQQFGDKTFNLALGLFPALCVYLLLLSSTSRAHAGGIAIGWGENQAWGGAPGAQTTFLETGVKGVAAGFYSTLLVKDDGTIASYGTWGDPYYAESSAATNLTGLDGVRSVAAGAFHSVALREDGTVVAWGSSSEGTNVPPGLTNAIQISAYGLGSRTLALTADGRVVAWGYGADQVPPGLSNIASVAAGRGGLALRPDGTVVGWGWSADFLNKIEQLTNVVAISAGYDEVLALNSDSTVTAFGYYPVPASLKDVVKIAASPGSDHHLNLALRSDGSVVMWGFNFYGWGGVPTIFGGVAVASGCGHCLALQGNGGPFIQFPPANRTGLAGGSTHFRVEATGALPMRYQWYFRDQEIPLATNAVLTLPTLSTADAGTYRVVVSNSYGTSEVATELSIVPIGIREDPKDVVAYAGGTAFMSVSAFGADLSYQWLKDGGVLSGATNSSLRLESVQLDQSGEYSVRVWNQSSNQVSGTTHLSVVPVLITQQPISQSGLLYGSSTLSVEAVGSGLLQYQWEFDGQALPGQTGPALSLPRLEKTNTGSYQVRISSVYGEVRSESAIVSVVPVAVWGSLEQKSVPADLTEVKALASGIHHAVALKADGTVRVWGDNSHGQMDLPSGLTNVVAVACGGYTAQTLALTHAGGVLQWGGDTYPPILPPPWLNPVVTMSSGRSHGIAITPYQEVVAWGSGEFGENRVPSELGLTNVVAVSAGGAHNLALRSDGTVVAWGAGGFVAQPGDWVNFGQSVVPPGLSNVVAIAAGEFHSVALKQDGSVVAWGDGWDGEIKVPAEATNLVSIAAGGRNTIGVRSDGTIVQWGSPYLIPPAGLSNVVAVAVGESLGLALISDEPIQTRSSVGARLTSEGVAFDVPTRSGRVYALEYTEILSEPDWKLLPLVAGNGELRVMRDPTAASTQRFYRVRSW